MERRYDIDWLRIIAIVLVLYFHTAMLFTAHDGWHIQNQQKSEIWGEFNFWLSRFRMPLLFFISGFGTFLALRKRSPWQYLKERHHRLIIPLVFAMLVVVPPQVYLERISKGATHSYWEFYPSIFQWKAYPEGNTSWHHMWFICYLFVYSVIGLPLFLWIRSSGGQKFIGLMVEKTCRVHGLVLMLPTILLAGFWTYWHQDTHDLVNDLPWHVYWFSFFLMGFIAGTSDKLWISITSNRKRYLGLGLLSITLVNYVRWNDINFSGLNEMHPSLGYAYLMLLAANGWLWLLAALGYAKAYLSKPHPLLPWANQAIYPFYILHQTVIIVIGYYVIEVEESILTKYLLISTVSLIGSVAIYEFLIRPFRITRFLFGVKEALRPSHTKGATGET